MTEPAEQNIQSLLDLLPHWVRGSGRDKCLVQLFVSFFNVNNIQNIAELNRNYEKFHLEYPTFLRVVELRELKLTIANTSFAKPRDGVLRFLNYLEEKKFEPGVYAILGAPYSSGQSLENASEANARTALSALSAMISILFGFACLHSKTCEFIVDVTNGNYSFTSPVIENPAFYKIDHARDIPITEIYQISKCITDAPSETKNLVAVALTYLDRAIREPNHGIRLSLYFSAIEVLTGEASTNSLCKILQMSHHDLRNMGYDDLLDRRTLFVHKGKTASLKRREERFLQYLIVDAISGKLGTGRTTYGLEYHIAVGKLTDAEIIAAP